MNTCTVILRMRCEGIYVGDRWPYYFHLHDSYVRKKLALKSINETFDVLKEE